VNEGEDDVRRRVIANRYKMGYWRAENGETGLK
jgi:hypothetical protein